MRIMFEDTFEGIEWTCMKYEDEGRMRILLKESDGLAEWNRGQAIPTCGWGMRHRVPANHIFALLCGLCLTIAW